ncbi:MAG: hypothetical protein F6K50_18650 [Moorea sp. SIO3I7]|nr:hypothetical protein [Moorena sp. SIO3I7]
MRFSERVSYQRVAYQRVAYQLSAYGLGPMRRSLCHDATVRVGAAWLQAKGARSAIGVFQ